MTPESPFSAATTAGWRPHPRYPDPAIEAVDGRFEKYWLKQSAVERLYTGCRWSEGPVWFGDGRYLLWSDIPNNRMLKWEEETGVVSIFRKPSNFANGNTRDRQGRLVTCEHGGRRVIRTEYDGMTTVVMDQWQGRPLNSPNDVVVKSETWSEVTDSEVANPGSGAEIIALRNGNWLLIGNDTERGRHRLAVMLSDDEGRSWKWKRYLERDEPGEEAGEYHYPSVIQAADGTLHATYSHHLNRGDVPLDEDGRPMRKSIKYVHFNEAWVKEGVRSKE
jgi:hypothetical protein